MKSTILIYNDEGAGKESANQLEMCLKEYVNDKYEIKCIKAIDILKKNWMNNCSMICFGGGYDLGFVRQLGSEGCEVVRNFISSGGRYLGICAGAYFGCQEIEFDYGGPLEVCGLRDLAFFRGKAIGPLYPGFEYESRRGIHAVPIETVNSNEHPDLLSVFYKGGCTFLKEDGETSADILYTYKDCGRPAIVQIGRVLLSGVHFEYDCDQLEFELLPEILCKLEDSAKKRTALINRLMLSIGI